MKSQNSEDYDIYRKIAFNEATDPIEILAIEYIKENPEMKGKEDKVKAFLKNQYGLNERIPEAPDADDDSPEAIATRDRIAKMTEAKEFSEMKMQADAKKALTRLNETFNKIEAPVKVAKTKEELQALRQGSEATYNKVVESLNTNLKELPIYIKNKEGQDIEFMKFTLTAQHKERINQLILETGVNESEVTAKDIENVVRGAFARFQLEHQAEIFTTLINAARAMSEEAYFKAYHNPQVPGVTHTPAPAGNKYQESRDKAFRMEMGN